MSTLTVTLILLVAATLIVVAGVNLLQTWRARGPRKPAGTTDRPPRAAPIESAPRGEPSLGLADSPPARSDDIDAEPGAVATAGLPDADGSETDPEQYETGAGGHADVAAAAPPPAARPAVAEPAPVRPAVPAPRHTGVALAELSDCIVELPLLNPLPGERLLAMAQSFRRVGAKPILCEGLARADAGEAALPARWAPLVAGVSYVSLRLGVLLANRHGPLNAMEYSEFIAGVNALGEHLSVLPETADMNAVLERARKLDNDCIQLDAQIGVNVDCAEPFSPADLARMATDLQLVERGNNRYARLNANGQVLFSVSLADQPNRLTFLLDVPRAPQQDQPWSALVAAAESCAQRLDGALVDDGSRPLSPASLGRIGDQLAQRYEALEQAGFPAGSALAMRLFN